MTFIPLLVLSFVSAPAFAAAPPVEACAAIDRQLSKLNPAHAAAEKAREPLLHHRKAIKCPGTPAEYAPAKAPKEPTPEEKAASAAKKKQQDEEQCKSLDKMLAVQQPQFARSVRVSQRRNLHCPGPEPTPK